MRQVCQSVYTFDELSEEAQEKALEWYREGYLDFEWYDALYDDFTEICKLLGVAIATRTTRHMTKDGGFTTESPRIYFSGFSSQGDGACYEGYYRYAKGSANKIRECAPRATELHRIADELYRAQRLAAFGLYATISHNYRYYFSRSMSIDVEHEKGYTFSNEAEEMLKEALYDLGDWLYKTLEEEHEWLIGDENLRESIMANDHEFTESGNPY